MIKIRMKKLSKYFSKQHLTKTLLTPKIPLTKELHGLSRFGTGYGGWTFLDSPHLTNSTVILAGAGEDISFDIALARVYKCKIIIVDPTVRAIRHVEGVMERIRNGISSDCAFNDTGKQDVGSYDLEGVAESQIVLEKQALWNSKGKVKFFAPQNHSHVSHSILNIQKTTQYVEVKCTTLVDIIKKYEIVYFPLLKLDIEGAEIEVLENMLDSHIRPIQILVDYDEMNFPNYRSKLRVERSYKKLISNGYELVSFDGKTNCLFIKKEI